MKSFRRCVAAFLAVLPSTCFGQLFWEFEDNAVIPPGWTEDDTDGSWSISPSLINPNYPFGKVLSASLNPPPSSSQGQGAENGDNRVETDTPEFRFQDFATALLNFDLGINPEGCQADGCLDAIQVLLVPIATGFEYELMHYFRRDPTTNEMPIVVSSKVPAVVNVDNQTVYRVRLRVFDGDTHPSVFEVDNLAMTSAYLTGDYNHNGTVDVADYIVWRDTLSQTAQGLAADGDGNGTVDQNDYLVWKKGFGISAAASAAASEGVAAGIPVPELRSISFPVVLVIGLAMNPAVGRWFLRRESRRRGRLASGRRGC